MRRVLFFSFVVICIVLALIAADLYFFRGRMTPFLFQNCSSMNETEALSLANKLVLEKDFSSRGFSREQLLNGNVKTSRSENNWWDVSIETKGGRARQLTIRFYADCDIQYLGSG
jgi:hypothetical protein